MRNMKKLLFLFLGVSILGVSACRKVTEQYYTTPNQTVYYTIAASSWTTGDGGKTFTADLSFKSGDIYQNDFDGVLVYVSFGNSIYEPVPQTYDGISYSYDVDNSLVRLRIQNSDGGGTINPPGVISAKLVLIPSQQ